LASAQSGQGLTEAQEEPHHFMDYDLGYFDAETGRLEPIDNPFGPKVLPMSPE
jgi:putative transposase